jgi:peroxiredoxin Q/BCP
VLGVSPDPVKAVKKFHDKQGLNFTLLADADHAVAERTASGARSRCTAHVLGVQRATFIIDADGVGRRT